MRVVLVIIRIALAGGCFWGGVAALRGEAIPTGIAGVILLAAVTFAVQAAVVVDEV